MYGQAQQVQLDWPYSNARNKQEMACKELKCSGLRETVEEKQRGPQWVDPPEPYQNFDCRKSGALQLAPDDRLTVLLLLQRGS